MSRLSVLESGLQQAFALWPWINCVTSLGFHFPVCKLESQYCLFLAERVICGDAGCLVAQLCLTLYDLMDCSPPGFFVYGISQARILEWIAISFSRESSQPRDREPRSPVLQEVSLPTGPPGKPERVIRIRQAKTSMMVRWVGIHLPMQGTWVWSLVWEDPTCLGGTKFLRHSYWSPGGENLCSEIREGSTRESLSVATKT